MLPKNLFLGSHDILLTYSELTKALEASSDELFLRATPLAASVQVALENFREDTGIAPLTFVIIRFGPSI